jgi:hypothetical protein
MYSRQKRCTVLGGSLNDRDHLEDLNIEHRIVLKWIFKKQTKGHRLY